MITFTLALIKEIEARADTKKEQLLKGGCATYEEYRSTVEHYQALMATVSLIKELARKHQDNE